MKLYFKPILLADGPTPGNASNGGDPGNPPIEFEPDRAIDVFRVMDANDSLVIENVELPVAEQMVEPQIVTPKVSIDIPLDLGGVGDVAE